MSFYFNLKNSVLHFLYDSLVVMTLLKYLTYLLKWSEVTKSWPTLYNPMFLPGESQRWGSQWADVYGITQSRTLLKWLSSSSNSTVAYQAPPSMEFSRQEYWSGLPCPSPEDLSNPGIEPGSLHCRQTLYHLSYQGFIKNVTFFQHLDLKFT